jgi:hypothetical protein
MLFNPQSGEWIEGSLPRNSSASHLCPISTPFLLDAACL